MRIKCLMLLLLSCSFLISKSEETNSKYGVVDYDAALLSYPEMILIGQKIDSLQKKTVDQLAPKYQELTQINGEMDIAFQKSDSIKYNSLREDGAIIYQEIKLIEQRAQKSENELKAQTQKYINQLDTIISNVGQEQDITLIMPKSPASVSVMNIMYGLPPMVLQKPLYYSEPAVDLTEIVIKKIEERNKSIESSKSASSGKSAGSSQTSKNQKKK